MLLVFQRLLVCYPFVFPKQMDAVAQYSQNLTLQPE